MNHEFIYFLKINIAIALFYAFYRLFFYRDTFFLWRRICLLGFVLISIIYPIFNIQDWIKEQGSMIAMADLYSTIILPEISAETVTATTGFTWKSIIVSSITFLYWGGVALLLAHFIIQLAGIIRLGIGTRTAYINNHKIHILTKSQGPFSFFKWIFIHPSTHTENEIEEILTHELTHVKQWHSVDVILSELLCIFCWLNPFVWLLKREVRNNLEYLADHKVLEKGYDHKIYQYHLLGLAHQKTASSLSNNFNILPLKNRIKMMNKKRTKQIERAKYLIFAPIIGLLLISSNIEIVARTTNMVLNVMMPVQESATIPDDVAVNIEYSPVLSTSPAELPSITENETLPENVIFEVVEQMPEFIGGQEALMHFLNRNIKYPVRAQEAGTQGRVIVQFVVDRDGSVVEPTLARGVSPELDKEALRVISSMPKWKPGMQRGREVRVKYTVPVMFRLES